MQFKDADIEESNFDLKSIINKVLAYWYLFIISIVICVPIAYILAHYSTPDYNINSKLIVQDQNNSPKSSSLDEGAGGLDLSDLLSLPSNALNEVQILKSRTLMDSTVRKLQLNVLVYYKGHFESVEMFDNIPFKVDFIQTDSSFTPITYKLSFKGDSIILLNGDEQIKSQFDKLINLKGFNLKFHKTAFQKQLADNYSLAITSVDERVDELSKNLTVDLTDKKSTVIDLSFTYPNPKKGELVLQTLMNLYVKFNLNNKVQIADSTLKFIDHELVLVSTELSGIENNFADFKRENKLADISEQSKALVGDASDYYKKLSDIDIQIALINDIQSYINDPKNKRIIPSSLNDQDPIFADAITKYDELIMDRDKMSLSYQDVNPVMQNLDSQIDNARQGLNSSFKAYKQSLEVSRRKIQNENGKLSNQIESVPQKEKVFLDYSRQQNLKQEIYLYLLQKREQTAISKTSTLSSANIIDGAKSDPFPYKPQKRVYYLVGFLLGVLIPGMYLYIKELLNVKIISKEDITKKTTVPIIGEIGNNSENSILVVNNNSRSIISEQFRALRTNLQFILKSNKSNVILITSSMSGEGKSFITANLASVFALSGKKVVMIELDLRKPKLSLNINNENSIGYTNYVVSDSIKLQDIIKPVSFSESCYIISSGSIPPNPSELLLDPKLELMIEELKRDFDYIVIDCAPVGLVSDAFLIEKHVDATLYVVRQSYTYKSHLNILNDFTAQDKIRNPYLIINDISNSKTSGYYGYGYGYGYGYSYGDYGQESKPPNSILKNDK